MHVMHKKPLLGTIILFTAALIWGAAFVFQYTGMDHLEPFTFTAVRVGLGAIVVRLIQCIVEKDFSFKNYDKKTIKCGIICGLLTFAVIGFQQVGLITTEPGKGGFITSLYIMLVPFFSRFVLKKHESGKTWFGVGIGIVGLFLLCVKPGEMSFQIGDIYIMLCALFFAMHVLYVSEKCSEVDSLSVNFIQLAVTSILAAVLAFAFEKPSWEAIVMAKTPILYCGIVSAGMGYTLQLVGQKHVKPTVAAVIMSFESVFSVFAGWLILNQMLSTRELIGCGIMFAANIIIQLPDPDSYSDDILRNWWHPNY